MLDAVGFLLSCQQLRKEAGKKFVMLVSTLVETGLVRMIYAKIETSKMYGEGAI